MVMVTSSALRPLKAASERTESPFLIKLSPYSWLAKQQLPPGAQSLGAPGRVLLATFALLRVSELGIFELISNTPTSKEP